MHQVKLFKGLESGCRDLEKEINDWLASENVRVINMFGNISPQSQGKGEALGSTGASVPSDIFITVLYEKD